MSRSYKKTPISKDHTNGMKKFANKKVRKYKGEIEDGNSYKKIFCSYDICDWSFRETYSDYLKDKESYKKRYLNGETKNNYGEDLDYKTWYLRFKRK